MSGDNTLADSLRQMLAVLETERQALAALDVDALTLSTRDKDALCVVLGSQGGDGLDPECRTLVAAARQKNEVNRKVRNLLAANVTARLDALTASPGTYADPQAQRI
ncbi:hypothetical protein CP97_04685 [Aurantiacibacter atlanticus]|uniref:Flagellar protein FlgN n=1 Tax=Aurantiacibacter atlanticus TaxID=1648404 RepID=A0A0H4VWN0_9SPHN|nr:hypothetical protein [Aurantiacibacter atlanticus]AKQ41478.1 hypothetical protein CP97_04685 [Aurantiacibacter atlanticus]MDF1833255.1 flagellar protein FlgN [Alteraurantiacibacter sp. bin_em_oilr2.035]